MQLKLIACIARYITIVTYQIMLALIVASVKGTIGHEEHELVDLFYALVNRHVCKCLFTFRRRTLNVQGL